MTSWKIEHCTVADGAALGYNNICAFWEDPNWRFGWPKDTTLDFLIEQSSKRQPRNLLRDREKTRHLKAVDPVTGELVGYARWILPEGRLTTQDGEPEWKEGYVPDVGAEEKKKIEEVAESAWWEAGKGMQGSDDLNVVVIKRILGESPKIKLDYLAVHPKNKSKGIGTALVMSGIEAANKMGLPVFCMAYKAGLGIYSRCGFKEVERIIQDTAQWGFEGEYGAYFMVYDNPNPS